ncbi:MULTISPECIES: phage replisome organizer N-terminal domain-containing protein [Bacillus]|uniref:Replication protein n=1 Tax=Bacillus thuringiensis serovar kumamotoensis TaxID=132267 RepID=A0A9X6PSB2_BACUK|nr:MULTISPECIES: phage replisome organizer N-terminal domain-containing protein [Bacillus cereus group]MED3465856.1 phage replisome organizer N-terminal domain-containing protein [Bacillus thuringiensis]MBJ8020561.1 phage replisome organizer N-terminal domain-containing protein [Bacillus cereus]MBJ8033754.1 phage replisome organizer N-terminal domain-containing protein [Bacillus cereus]MEC2873333.1 phage replisome organizer N-terminal domain-containing protein [Bacillus cereus]OTZ76557.1 repli
MSEVKWIKLTTNMFEDEKIKLIESMPEADTLLIIWIKLLAQAGKTNANGYIFLNENIPYTEEMLATIFNRPLQTVRYALQTFKQFGMIEIDDKQFISISNWGKHQSLTGLDKIREDTKKRVAAHRERKKQALLTGGNDCNVTGNSNETDKEEELEKELELEKDINKYIVEIVTYLNQTCNTSYRVSTKKTRDLIKARFNQGFNMDDFKKVIDIKASHWIENEEYNQYLRPSTLFGNKFEEYLNQQPKKGVKKRVGINRKSDDSDSEYIGL